MLQPESVSNRVKFDDRLALTSVTVTLQGRVLLGLLLVSDMQYLYSQGKDSSILIRLMEDGPVHVLSYSKQFTRRGVAALETSSSSRLVVD